MEFRGKFTLPVDAFIHLLKGLADFERAAEKSRLTFVKTHVHSKGFYNCNATIVIYTCILSRYTCVNFSAENTFIKFLVKHQGECPIIFNVQYLQARLYTCKTTV